MSFSGTCSVLSSFLFLAPPAPSPQPPHFYSICFIEGYLVTHVMVLKREWIFRKGSEKKEKLLNRRDTNKIPAEPSLKLM